MKRLQEESPIDLKAEHRVEVLVSLLQSNRQEIREWQKSLFDASLWFNAGILGITAFIHGLNDKPNALLVIVGIGMACLCGFYFIFSHVAKRAIEMSGHDLLKIQRALRLQETGYYLGGEPIYPDTAKWLPQNYINWLRALNLTVCTLAVLSFAKL